MQQQRCRIHISEFCDRVYRQHINTCGTPLEARETTTNGGAGNFDDAAAEAEWRSKWGQQTPIIHLDSVAPDDVYEGFDDKARPIDSVPAYLSQRSGISYGDAVDYIYRAVLGCQWDGLKRVSGEVRRDLTKIAQAFSAHFSGDAMDELVDWFVDMYPQEAAEMDLAEPSSEQDGLRNQVQVNMAVWKYLARVNDRQGLTSKDIATGLGIAERDSMVRKSPAWKDYREKMKKARRVPSEAIEGRADQSSDGQSALDNLVAQEDWEAVGKEQQKEELRQHRYDVPQPRPRRHK